MGMAAEKQALLTPSVRDSMKKLQLEVLEGIDIGDFRLHVFTVFVMLRHKLDYMKARSDSIEGQAKAEQ